MRRELLGVVSAATLALAGCVGDPGGAQHPGDARDGAPAADDGDAGDAAVQATGDAQAGEDASSDAASEAAPGLACVSPGDCPSSSPICCGTVTLAGGNVPECNAGAYQTTCTSSCDTSVVDSCVGTDQGWLCVTSADCAANGAEPHCCDLPIPGVSACVSDDIEAVLGTPCH